MAYPQRKTCTLIWLESAKIWHRLKRELGGVQSRLEYCEARQSPFGFSPNLATLNLSSAPVDFPALAKASFSYALPPVCDAGGSAMKKLEITSHGLSSRLLAVLLASSGSPHAASMQCSLV